MATGDKNVKINFTTNADAVSKSIGLLNTVTGGLVGNMIQAAEATGLLSVAQGLLTTATTASTTAMGLFKIALASTGIGLLLVALGSLVAYFTQTEAGAEKMNAVMETLKFTISDLIGIAVNLGEFLVTAFEDPERAARELNEFLRKDLIPTYEQLAKKGFFGIAGNLGQTLKEKVSGTTNANRDPATNTWNLSAIEAGKASSELTKKIKEQTIALYQFKREQGDLADNALLIAKNTALTAAERAKGAQDYIDIQERVGKKEAEITTLELKRMDLARDRKKADKTWMFADEEEYQKLLDKQEDQNDKVVDARKSMLKQMAGLSKEEAKALKDAQKEAEQEAQKHADAVRTYKNQLDNDIRTQQAQTEQEKLDKQKQDDLIAIEQLKLTEEEKISVMVLYDEKYILLQSDLNEKLAKDQRDWDAKQYQELEEIEQKKIDDRKAFDEKYKLEEMSFKDTRNQDEINAVRDHQQNIIKELEWAAILKEQLEGNSAEKIKQIHDYYGQQSMLINKDAAEQSMQLDIDKVRSAQNAVDQLASVVDQETGFGRALLVAKQLALAAEMALGIKEMLFHQTKTISKVTLTAAESGVDLAAGAAKTAGATPFPANIPMIIGYAVSAVSIAMAIKQALSKVKGANSAAVGGSSGAATPPPTATPNVSFISSSDNQLANSFSNTQKNSVIKAYVVASEVTTAQALDRNVITKTSIG